MLVRILPSQSCGPFRAFTKDLHYMYSSATDVVVDVPSSVQTFIWFLGSWIFFVVVMVIIRWSFCPAFGACFLVTCDLWGFDMFWFFKLSWFLMNDDDDDDDDDDYAN